MIEVDLNIIRQLEPQIEESTDKTKINNLLYDVLFSTARMLLITRGGEPKTSKEVFDLFISKFIDAGLVDTRFRNIVLLAGENNKADFSASKKEISELAQTVIALYEGMDDSLQFKNVPKETPVKQKPGHANVSKAFKDLRGVACPMNFVKTKIELSALHSGDLLEILLDDGAPIENVPGSVRNQGHEVIETKQEGDHWKVLIRKGRND